MVDVVERVLETVRAGGLLPAGRPLVVMLSGGRDSVCLLDVAVALAGQESVAALHVNYGLRVGADGDERHCRELCRDLGVALTVEHAREPRQGNLHAWARDLRYGAAARLALARGAQVAAGHTATDQVETILYRLASSPGRRALLGMPARNGRLVRPLLELSRQDTGAYCRARGRGWREDDANGDPAYARARVRGALVPALRALHPAAERNVARTARELRDEAAVLDSVVDETLQGRTAVPGAELAAMAPALRRLALRRLAEGVAGRPAPDAAERADELLALCERPGCGELSLRGGVRALVEYGTLRFAGSAGSAVEAAPAPRTPQVLPVPGVVRFGSWRVHADRGLPEPRQGVIDADAAVAGLTVRGWRPGDRMAPIGLGGTRTLQDLFTDRRVPRARRLELPVIECDGEIAWVPGVATSERFGIGPATTRAIALRASPAA